MSIAELAQLTFFAGAIGAAILFFAFWLWMLIDCLTTSSLEGRDRLLWVLVLLLIKPVGAVLYFFLQWRRRATPTATASAIVA